jgi:hypothetical protein
MAAGKRSAWVYFAACLAVLTPLFLRGYLGVQSDALYYYSTAVSLVWDGDLDLRNQFDHPRADSPGGTVASGQYFVDRTTGKAFSLFNPGTGILMVPLLALARGVDAARGNRHPDPYDAYYQRCAGFTSVILTALALALLFSILRTFCSAGAALVLPPLFLLGTNWLFYAVVFAGWSHAPALCLCVVLVWAFLNYERRRNVLSAALFGLAGGALFSTRNFGIVFFLTMAVALGVLEFRRGLGGRTRNIAANASAGALFFFLGAAPQFYVFTFLHGSPFRTSLAAAARAVKPFGFLEAEPFQAIHWSNLAYLGSNLFNPENGLFAVHPLFLAGLLGAVLLRPKDARFRALMIGLWAGVFFLWLADAAYYDNWFHRAAGAGFGHRRFLDALPAFVFGAALIWEKAKENRWSRRAVALAYAILFSGATMLLYHFLFESKALFAARTSWLGLQGYLFGDVRTVAITAAAFIAILPALRTKRSPGEQPSGPTFRKPALAGLLIAAALVPVFLFRGSPTWERGRFLAKKGFFLLYTLNPSVDVRGGSWGWPEGGKRALLGSEAPIRLPSPLSRGDTLLFRLEPNFNPSAGTSLEVALDGETIGRAALQDGDRIYAFPIEKDLGARKGLLLRVDPARAVPRDAPALFVFEGRVLLKESDDPPFGHIDLPEDDRIAVSGKTILEGWALDDRDLSRIYAVGESGRVIADAERIAGARPEIGRIFVLYPDIYRTAWRIEFDPALLPDLRGRIVRLRIIAEDRAGHKTVLGGRTIYFRLKNDGPDKAQPIR